MPTTSTSQNICELTRGIGELVRLGSATEADPIVINLPETRPTAYPDFLVRLWVTERTNQTEVLFVEMEIMDGNAATLNLDELKEWTDAYNTRLLFGTIETQHNGTGDGERYVTKMRHALVLDGLTQTALETVLATMQSEGQRCYRMIRILMRTNYAKMLRARQSRTALSDLDALVGLQSVKGMVHGLAAQQRVERERQKFGLQPTNLSPHLVFTGNPGTGKTTVARLIGRMFKEIGLLSKGHVVEVDRSGLVAKYVGQTAIKTKEVCERAIGGVLFIDEAYSLTGTGNDFGPEAIEALLTFMEEQRGKCVVIVAGYEAEMAAFIASNPGLRSRFDRTIDFPDYSDDELVTIFDGLVEAHDYVLDDAARSAVRSFIAAMPRGDGFGNARDTRRLFNDVVCNHASMLSGVAKPTKQQLQLISADAIPRVSIPVPAKQGSAPAVERWAGYL